MMWAFWQCNVFSGIGNGFTGLLHRIPDPASAQLHRTKREGGLRMQHADPHRGKQRLELPWSLGFFHMLMDIADARRRQNEAHSQALLQGCTKQPVSSNDNATTEPLPLWIAQPWGPVLPAGAM